MTLLPCWPVRIGWLLLCGFFCAPASAAWKTNVSDQFNFTPTYYFEDLQNSTSQWSTFIREQVDVTSKPTRDLKLKLTPVVFSDPSSPSVPEQFSFDVLEANVDYRLSNFRFKVGMNSVSWGSTDIFNPLDVVSARRYTDFLNIEKRGVPSVILTYDDGTWLFEGIFVPVQQISILPGDKSRWFPRDIAYAGGNNLAQVYFSNPFAYQLVGPAVDNNSLQDNFGFRAEHHGSGLDLTAIFFQGAPSAPAILIPNVLATASYLAPQGQPKVVIANQAFLQPVYYLRQTVGASAVVTLSTVIIRLAAAYSDRILDPNPLLPSWESDIVLGIEKNFSIGKEGTLTALLQGTDCNHGDPPGDLVTSINRVFDQSYLLGLRYQASPTWTYSLAGLFDVRYNDGYATAKFEHKLTDGLTSSLEYDWLDGSAGTPLGTYRKNKRVALGLVASF